MSTLEDLSDLAQTFRQRRDDLAGKIDNLKREIDAITLGALQSIRASVAAAAQAEDELRNAIEAAPELFEKPRTRTLHGIRFGIMTAKARVEIPNEAETIRRIREQLPEEQAELLISVSERVSKPAVADLTVADLKRLQIRVEPPVDEAFIKPVDSEVEKAIKALLGDALKQLEQAPCTP